MNLGSIYDKLDHKDRCHIQAILCVYSSDYTVICKPSNYRNAMPLMVFFDIKKVVLCLRSWQHDRITHYNSVSGGKPYVDHDMFDRVIRMIKIMQDIGY